MKTFYNSDDYPISYLLTLAHSKPIALVEPIPIANLEMALQSAKGNEIEDCSMILNYIKQHPFQVNEFLGCISPSVHSELGVTAALRYTWQKMDDLSNWKPLLNKAFYYYKHRVPEPETLFVGLLQFVDPIYR
jgi:hypothetical protein